jgi:hypothetical protein
VRIKWEVWNTNTGECDWRGDQKKYRGVYALGGWRPKDRRQLRCCPGHDDCNGRVCWLAEPRKIPRDKRTYRGRFEASLLNARLQIVASLSFLKIDWSPWCQIWGVSKHYPLSAAGLVCSDVTKRLKCSHHKNFRRLEISWIQFSHVGQMYVISG